MDFLPQLAWTDIVSIASFLLITVVVLAVGALFLRFINDPVRERLEAIARMDPSQLLRTEIDSSFSESLAKQLPKTKADNGMLIRDMRRAGYYKPTAARDFLAFRNGLVLLAIILTVMFVVALGPDRQALGMRILFVGCLVAATCYALPRLMIQRAAKRRVERIRRGLPDALDMTTMCLSGGMPLPDALVHVSREMHMAHSDLSVELVIVRQQGLITSLDVAFEQFASRIDHPETTAVAAMMEEGLRLGTDLVAVIREFADNLRIKRRQMADEQAGKATVQLLLPVTFCLLPAAIIYMWGPAVTTVIDFFSNFEGIPRNLVP